MKTRLKQLRKTLNLTQGEFGRKIGMSDVAISYMESGRTAVNNQNVNLICLTFGVSEQWLRSGEGDMFASKEGVQGEDELIEIYRNLLDPNREVVLNTAKSLLKAQDALQEASKEAPPEKGEASADPPPQREAS